MVELTEDEKQKIRNEWGTIRYDPSQDLITTDKQIPNKHTNKHRKALFFISGLPIGASLVWLLELIW